MYLPETYQVKAILFHKGDLGKSSHKRINWRAFLDLIYGDEYQQKLKDKKLLGLMTHAGRKGARNAIIPHADAVAIDPNLCNVLTGVSDDENCVYGYFDLVDTEAADRFKKMIKMGVDIGVSISTELIQKAGEYVIQVLHGVDFTLYPEFDSPILDINFSEGNPDMSMEVDYPVENPQLQFGDFSLKDYIRESTYPAYRVLSGKVREVINYIKYVKESTVYSNKRFIRSYLSSYIRKYLNECISSSTPINLIMGLRLDEYVDDRVALRELNQAMNAAKSELKGGAKVMSSSTQKRLNASFNKVMAKLYEYIEGKSGKKKDISSSGEFSMEEVIPIEAQPGDLDLVKPDEPSPVDVPDYKAIEDFILDNYTRPDFFDAYRNYLSNIDKPIEEPLLGDTELGNLSEKIRDGYYQVEPEELKTILDSQSFNFDYEPYHEVFALARDCREMNPEDYEGFKNAFEFINVKYPDMEKLCTEKGPSLEELVEKLGDDYYNYLGFINDKSFPLAYYQLTETLQEPAEFAYDPEWYAKLKPETIARLAFRRANPELELDPEEVVVPEDSSSVSEKLNSPVVKGVMGTLTGAKPLNFIDKTMGNVRSAVTEYTGETRHAEGTGPQGITSRSFSEVADQIIRNARAKGLQNQPPVKDNTKSEEIPTGDKPDKPLGGNPNKKDMSNMFTDTVNDIVESYIYTSNSRDPHRDMAARKPATKLVNSFGTNFEKGMKSVEKGIKSTTLGKTLLNTAESAARVGERKAMLMDKVTSKIPLLKTSEDKANAKEAKAEKKAEKAEAKVAKKEAKAEAKAAKAAKKDDVDSNISSASDEPKPTLHGTT